MKKLSIRTCKCRKGCRVWQVKHGRMLVGEASNYRMARALAENYYETYKMIFK